jgi:hypothetical protein
MGTRASWMVWKGARPVPGGPWVGCGKGGRGVPRLFVDVRITRLSGMGSDVPRCNDKEALAFLDKSVFREVGVHVTHVVASASDVMEEHQEIGFVLFAGR